MASAAAISAADKSLNAKPRASALPVRLLFSGVEARGLRAEPLRYISISRNASTQYVTLDLGEYQPPRIDGVLRAQAGVVHTDRSVPPVEIRQQGLADR